MKAVVMPRSFGLAMSVLFAMVVRCSLITDFRDGIPCGADGDCDGYVCTSGRCRARGALDAATTCDQSADSALGINDQCQEGRQCIAANGDASRCLLPCTPTTYATPAASANVAAECTDAGTTCFEIEGRRGACASGVCDEVADDCPGENARCVAFNGAGICFTTCTNIFREYACVDGAVCHPIGDSDVTACVAAGARRLGEMCSDRDLCRKADDDGRLMMCGRPRDRNVDQQYRCSAICPSGDNSYCTVAERCLDTTGPDLGICRG